MLEIAEDAFETQTKTARLLEQGHSQMVWPLQQSGQAGKLGRHFDFSGISTSNLEGPREFRPYDRVS